MAQQRATEAAALRAQLAQLEADRIDDPPQAGAPPPVLFVNQSAIDRARDAAIAARDGDKKPSLPDIVPGFKANSLDVRESRVPHSHLFGALALAPHTTVQIYIVDFHFVGLELPVAKGPPGGSDRLPPVFLFRSLEAIHLRNTVIFARLEACGISWLLSPDLYLFIRHPCHIRRTVHDD